MSENTAANPATTTNEGGNEPAPAVQPKPNDSTPPSKTFTQAEVDAIMAKNKRTLQQELEQARTKAAGFDELNNQVRQLLDSGLISDAENLSDFREQASATLERFKSEQEKLMDERTKQQKALEEAQKRAEQAQQRYNDAQALRAISDEAVSKAEGPGAVELIQMKLKPLSEVNPETGEVTVRYPITDEDGNTQEKKVTVAEAIEAMEADVSRYGRLFKSTVNSGAGGGVVDGVKRNPDGRIDFSKMTMEQYLELQSKNPGLIEQAMSR